MDAFLCEEVGFYDNAFGIQAVNANNMLFFDKNFFVNNGVGINLREYNTLSITGNEFLGSGSNAIQQFGGIPGAVADVQNNTFNSINLSSGIAAAIPPSRAQVQFNDFVTGSYNVGLIGFGSQTHQWAVQHNPMMFVDQGARANILLYNTNNARVFRNTDMVSDGTNNILIQGGQDNLVGYNTLGDATEGIRLDNSPLSDLYCNDIDNTGIGLQVLNDSRGAIVRGNQLDGNGLGLRYGTPASSMAYTGPQPRRGNTFDLGESTEAIHLGSQQEARLDQYLVPRWRMQGDEGYPFFAAAFDRWFDNPNGSSEYSCPEGILPPTPGDELPEKLLAGAEVAFALKDDILLHYGTQVAQTHQLGLAKDILRIHALGRFGDLSLPLQTWATQQAPQLAVQPFAELLLAKSNAFLVDEADYTYYSNQLATASNTTSQLSSLKKYYWDSLAQKLIYDPLAAQDIATYKGQLTATAQGVSGQKANFLQTLAADIADLKVDNAALNHQNILPLEVWQAVTTIELDYFTNGTVDGKDRNELLLYANMCPAEAGEGVYTARALLSILDEELKMDYTDECVGMHKRKAVVEEEQSLAAGISLSPNPTKDRALVSWPAAGGYSSLQVWSLDGRLLQEQALVASQTQFELDLAEMPVGTYLVKLIGESATQTLRMIKQ
ncbi:MAG: T9SS C-terminal target domain-containing protein [Bacteroidetes bacterium]|nr:MAG: T9SS C-terminal target domain-containing protein [Bacteroidota bacterium]